MTSLKTEEKALAYLCWIDCIEKFDVLLQELRAIQLNLAYQLRAESITMLLRYEEALLNTPNEFQAMMATEYSASTLAKSIVLDLPSPELLKRIYLPEDLTPSSEADLTEKYSKIETTVERINTLISNLSNQHASTEDSPSIDFLKKDLHAGLSIDPPTIFKNIEKKINTPDTLLKVVQEIEDQSLGLTPETLLFTLTIALYQTWQTTFWGLDQRQLYYNLRATQTLKRTILKDKLALLQKGFEAFTSAPKQANEKIYNLLMLRRVYLIRARHYVKRVSDHQSSLATMFDQSMQDTPRPLTTRRRDQAIYSRVLNDMCAEVHKDLCALLKECGEKTDELSEGFSLIHRWDYEYTSEYRPLFDTSATISHAYLKTSYWMPDRPDLQSAIVHEVGHAFVDVVFNNFSSKYFHHATSDFASLFRRLKSRLSAYNFDRKGDDIDSVIRELGVDILAASVKGSSYLYALVIELLGEGVELMYGRDVESLLEANLSATTGIAYIGPSHAWHFRLHVTCLWIELIKEERLSPLARKLIDGVRALSDGLLKHIEQLENRLTDGHTTTTSTFAYCSDLKESLCRAITGSYLPITVTRFKQNSHNAWPNYDSKGNWDPCYTPDTSYQSTPPLAKEARKFLINGLLSHKKSFWQSKNGEEYTVTPEFAQNYFLEHYGTTLKFSPPDANGEASFESPHLFKSLHDIAWQCAVMKGLDFAVSSSNLHDSKELKLALRLSPVLGRGIYQAAVDFHYFKTENPLHHLAEVTQLLAPLQKESQGTPMHDLFLKLDQMKLWSREGNKGILEQLKSSHEGSRAKRQDRSETLEKIQKHLSTCYAILSETQDIQLFRSKTLLASALEEKNIIAAEKIAKSTLDSLCARRNKFSPLMPELAQHGFIKEKFSSNGELTYDPQEIVTPLKSLPILLDKIRQYLENFWPIDIAQLHSFLRTVIDSQMKDQSDQTIRKALSQHRECPELIYDTGSSSCFTPGVRRALSFTKISTAHMGKVTPDLFLHKGKKLTIAPDASPVPMLGRFDLISLRKEAYPSQTELSNLNIYSKRLFPCFLRKETVFPINLTPFSPPSKEPTTETQAVICVQLNRSSWRFHYLSRLLDSFHSLHNPASSTDCYDIEIASHLKPYDRLYLSDGCSDLIIEIREEPGKSRIDDIFSLKDLLYDDFLTGKMETLPSAAVLEQAALRPDFLVTLDISLRQSRYLTASLAKTKKSLQQKLDKNISVYSQHGRMDIRVILPSGTVDFTTIAKETIAAARMLDCPSEVDRIQFSLSKKEESI